MSFGLIGKNIQHSYSPMLHKILGYYDYSLIEVDGENLQSFLEAGNFSGLNVTVPYKERVLKFIQPDKLASTIGACNTIYRYNGKLLGTNTDFFGFMYLLSYHNIDLKNKKILILGNGGASKTVQSILALLETKEVFIATRKAFKNIENKIKSFKYVNYTNLPKDIDVIINTTPLGTYPNIEASPLESLDSFNKCQLVIDLIYNPNKTKLMLMATEKNIKAVNGMAMLVAQGTKSAEFFINLSLGNINNKLISILSSLSSNILLIGMGGCGKSHLGKALASSLNRPFLDSDAIMEEREAMAIDDIISTRGIDYFRALEEDVIKELSIGSGQVIATGGGSITSLLSQSYMRANSLIIFIDRPMDEENFNKIFSFEKRPLYKTYNEWKAIYNKRYQIYEDLADIKILNNNNTDDVIKDLIERIDKYYEENFRN